MMMFSDEYLEYWGTVYVAARLLEQGIPFQEFLADPRGCLKAAGLQSAPLCIASGYRPLLPRQAKVAQVLWRCWGTETGGRGPAIPEPDERLMIMEEAGSEP
jgi:hypothetical protein